MLKGRKQVKAKRLKAKAKTGIVFAFGFNPFCFQPVFA